MIINHDEVIYTDEEWAQIEAHEAEQAWEAKLERIIAEDERAQEAEEDNPTDEFDENGPTAAGHGYGY